MEEKRTRALRRGKRCGSECKRAMRWSREECVEGLGGCGDVAVGGAGPECEFESGISVVEG